MERFDIFNAKQNHDTEPVPSVETATAATKTNGHTQSRSSSASEVGVKREAEPSDSEDDTVYDAPPKKKRKDNSKDIAKETDAEIAARLQAQEDRAARPTRGAAPRKAAPAKKKKTPKKKTAARVTGSDDSDVEDGGGTGRKVNRETGFHKPMNLSATAAEFFGVPQVSSRIYPQLYQPLTHVDSFLGPKLRSRSGHTSKIDNYRTRVTSATSFAMTSSRPCSNKTRYICFR